MKNEFNELEMKTLIKMTIYDKYFHNENLVKVKDKKEYFEYLLYLSFITLDNYNKMTKYKDYMEFSEALGLATDEFEKLEVDSTDYSKFVHKEYPLYIHTHFNNSNEKELLESIDYDNNDLIFTIKEDVKKQYKSSIK